MSKSHNRPKDILYVNSDGTKAKIAFVWGKKGNSIPKGLHILIRLSSHKRHDFKIKYDKAIYQNFSQARKQGIRLVEGIVELLNVPLSYSVKHL